MCSRSLNNTKNKLRNLEYAIVSTTQDVDTQLMRSQWNSTRIAKACKHRGFSFILCVRLPEISHNQRLARHSWAHIWCERHHFCCENDSNLIVAYTFCIFSINSNSAYSDAIVSNKNVCFYFKYPMIIGQTGNFCLEEQSVLAYVNGLWNTCEIAIKMLFFFFSHRFWAI